MKSYILIFFISDLKTIGDDTSDKPTEENTKTTNDSRHHSSQKSDSKTGMYYKLIIFI